MATVDFAPDPGDLHYAKLLAALCRSARAKPAEHRSKILRGVVRSVCENPEPERSLTATLILRELPSNDGRELEERIALGASGEVPVAAGPAGDEIARSERRRNRDDALSTPWLSGRDRRARP